jgi:quercetin dioxygenase-like cupin family protein
MRKRLMWMGLVTAGVVVMSLYPTGKVHATPSQGFTSTTLSQGRFGAINVFSYFVPDTGKPWLSLLKTQGQSDLFVLSNVWQPGGSTGWHTHPGPTLVTITAGTVTEYDGDDPSCTPHVYTAGSSFFVDPGGSHVHLVRNEGTVAAQAIAVRLIPTGQPGRIDAPAPGNCPF